MTEPKSSDAVSTSFRTLLSLFESELEALTFGDIDAASLRSCADAVRTRAAEVESARVSLEMAQAALEADRRVMFDLGERALAYARIFAASGDNTELSETLESLEIQPSASNKRKTRRAKKSSSKRGSKTNAGSEPGEKKGSQLEFGAESEAHPAAEKQGESRHERAEELEGAVDAA